MDTSSAMLACCAIGITCCPCETGAPSASQPGTIASTGSLRIKPTPSLIPTSSPRQRMSTMLEASPAPHCCHWPLLFSLWPGATVADRKLKTCASQ
ncbi:hypothetical protein WR25_16519 [Diploscapter pachys]|uniref:Uncharacterized protein n=1 Tax=Diploscapter pachys TaxID=2018661 RepID=A0A2A2KIV7_9BILA|nr:hypothetical protein WR25_16519 [Diploscapter pachys]